MIVLAVIRLCDELSQAESGDWDEVEETLS